MPQRDYSEALREMERLVAAAPADDEAAAELWMDSEGVVDCYIDAAHGDSASVPTRQELGRACFWMARMANLLGVCQHRDLILDLLSPPSEQALSEIRPVVAALKEACLSAAQTMASDGRAPRWLVSEGDAPF